MLEIAKYGLQAAAGLLEQHVVFITGSGIYHGPGDFMHCIPSVYRRCLIKLLASSRVGRVGPSGHRKCTRGHL